MYEQLHGLYWLFDYLLLALRFFISPSTKQPPPPTPTPPQLHTLSSCVAAAGTLQIYFSESTARWFPVRFCQRDAIKGNWKWKIEEGLHSCLPRCSRITSAQTVATSFFALSSSFATLLRYEQISYPLGSQRPVRPCSPTLRPNPSSEVQAPGTWRELP